MYLGLFFFFFHIMCQFIFLVFRMMHILGKDLFLAAFNSIKIWRLNCDIIASL